MNLLKNTKWYHLAVAVVAASNTDDDSAIIDTAGYEGCVFVTELTDSAATGVATMTVEQNTLDSASGMAALGATGVVTKTCTVNDDINSTLLVVDCYRPRERYLRVNRTSATANIAFGPVIAILYGPRVAPVSQDTAEVSDSDTAVSAAEA